VRGEVAFEDVVERVHISRSDASGERASLEEEIEELGRV
jgi:hypothetical protein